MRSSVNSYFCTNGDMAVVREHDVDVVYKYRGMDGGSIGELLVSKNDCRTAARPEEVHRGRLPVILNLHPRQRITRRPQVRRSDMRDAVSGPDNFDLTPEFGVVRRSGERNEKNGK